MIHPLSEDSPVQKFLDKRGGGLHYLSTVMRWTKIRLKEKGYRLSQKSHRSVLIIKSHLHSSQICECVDWIGGKPHIINRIDGGVMITTESSKLQERTNGQLDD